MTDASAAPPTSLARNMARLFGILWIAANLVNTWRLFSTVTTIENPYERFGYAAFGLVAVPLIFYCAYHVVAMTTKIVRCLKILLAISLLPVLLHGLIPLELAGWIVLILVPTQWLLKAFFGRKDANAGVN